jgi:ketosteroid isomerase-like protein
LSAAEPVTTRTLEAFTDAWNRHDVDALMAFMSGDCVFMTAAGPDSCGTRHVGRAAVRAAFAAAWATVTDAQWTRGRHFVFREGRIQTRNAFRKARPNLPATPR